MTQIDLRFNETIICQEEPMVKELQPESYNIWKTMHSISFVGNFMEGHKRAGGNGDCDV